MLDKQPDGKEVIKITIKNTTLGRQTQVQKDTRVKFVKPKSPEVGKWKRNEAKVQHKRIKPTFDMLLSKYANHAAGSSSNRSPNLKHSRSPQVQKDTRVKFVKPKSPEVGKWKRNEAKVQHKRIKPTFDMLLSKYANHAAGSSSNRSPNLKHSRSPPREEFQHHARPYGSWASGPWVPSLPYVPYYMGDFNGGWWQPPMALMLFIRVGQNQGGPFMRGFFMPHEAV